jgi:2-polyprenyl-6-methoxyphenol hydroxylase-like FAD-dependent oxidoreductase
MNELRTAVVIGGGMGGLLAASALATRFQAVIVIDRDVLPDDASHRKGVPQSPHIHGLLKRGELNLESLFPGIIDELCRRGAECVTIGSEMHWYHYDRWKTTCDEGIVAIFLTRPFLEAEVRRRVRALPNVRFMEQTVVTGYTCDRSTNRITGVSYKAARDASEETALSADIVVDSSGRGTHAPDWLEKLGYGRPKRLEVKVRTGYSTVEFQRTSGADVPWKALVVVPSSSTRFGAVMPVEGNRWIALPPEC